MIFKRHTQKSICAEGGQLISMTQMSVPMVRKHNISASFLLTMCFICHPAIAETWRCEPREGFEKIGSRAPKELYFSEIPMLNFTIHNGELNGTIVSDDPYSFSLRSNYTSARYRTFSDVSRWTTHVFKMHGTFKFDYFCIRRS
ncbi:MAG: hypothetical protein EBW61_11380 [Rhodobacteraceae bacterium]|nr:hypothetical protein [Paracoccaceae bacterium]